MERLPHELNTYLYQMRLMIIWYQRQFFKYSMHVTFNGFGITTTGYVFFDDAVNNVIAHCFISSFSKSLYVGE